MSSATTFSLQNTCSAPLNMTTNCKLRGIFRYFLHRGSVTHSLFAAGTSWVSSACLCRACSSTAGGTPISEEQRFRWAERLFWDLNFLPQMGQSATPGGGGGGGAGALSSLSSKHLQKGDHSQSIHQSNDCSPNAYLCLVCCYRAVRSISQRLTK